LNRREKRKEYRQEMTDWGREGLVGRIYIDTEGEENSAVLEEIKRRQEEGKRRKWKEEREKREKEAAEDGKGYGDLIMDQVWEVWNWRRRKSETDEDEKNAEGKDRKGDKER